MRYHRRNCGNYNIDWKRTIISCAIIIVVISVIQMILRMLGFGYHGLLILCLAIIVYYFGPMIWRNIKLSRNTKAANKRPKVKRSQLMDLD